MFRPALARAALGVVAVGVLALIWLRRDGASEQAPTAAPPRRETAPAVATPRSRHPFSVAPGRRLLAALEQLLAEENRRSGEALLAFKDQAALRRFLERATKSGLVVIDRIDALNTVRVRHDALDALQRELTAHADDYADLSGNSVMHIPSAPARENRPIREQIPFGNATLAFLGAEGDRADWGRGVTIAIIDSGVAADETFGDRLRRLDIGRGLNPGHGEGDGHGTSVAALAGGIAPDAAGVAPAANLLSLRVTDAEGVSDVFTVAQAIVAAVDAGAKILNISLGGHSTNGTLDAAIAYATERGALIVAAAGNDQAARLAWPAADDRVISVGAVDKAEQQVSFSNSGPQLKLSAPGYGVQTAWLDGQRAYVDGTSASAPLVAGALAAVISQNPGLTSAEAATLLRETASDAGAPGADPDYGGGILNLGWAMNRTTPGYVDTAISSHYFDPENSQMQFVVQNRGSHAVTGLTLDATTDSTTRRFSIPILAAGETFVVSMPVAAKSLAPGSSLRFTTQLSAPPGLTDRVPANNRRSSVLSTPSQ